MQKEMTVRGADIVRRLIAMGHLLTSRTDLDVRMVELLRQAAELFDCDRCSIMLWDGEYYRATYNWGNPPGVAAEFNSYRVPAHAPLIAEAERNGSFVVVNDARLHPATRTIAEHANIESIVVAHMTDVGGERLGFMTAEYNKRMGTFDPLFAEAVAGIASLAQATLISSRDRRDREASEADRGRMLAELARAEQRERQRISNDIHDDVLQRVTSIGHFLEVLSDDVDDPETRSKILRLQTEARESAESLRRLVDDLHPIAVEVGSMRSALEGLAARMRDVSDSEVVLRVDGDHEPPIEQAGALYRIVQQALDNTWIHAAARSVEVVVALSADGTHATVTDDGIGFDRALVEPGRIGLFSMTQRAERLDGTCTFISSAEGGTSVRVFLPNPPLPSTLE